MNWRTPEVPAPIRAPLVHYYFELIHPFWDGNGRVGRVLEASVLHHAGFRFAPFAMARYYLEYIDRYFTLFNLCRKQAEKKEPHPNAPFVIFHLEGMLSAINRLHDRVNAMVGELYSKRASNACGMQKKSISVSTRLWCIDGAQQTIRMDEGVARPGLKPSTLNWATKTKQRDLSRLREFNC